MKFTKFSLLALVVACAATGVVGETKAPKSRVKKVTRVVGSMPKPQTPPAMADSTMQQFSQATVTNTDQPITKRRPMADAGLRYSSSDWLVSLLTTPTSYILKRIISHVAFNIAIAVAVTRFHNPEAGRNLSIPMTGHSLLASSLGLLLGYRTNSAYSRFYEARGHWTKVKSVCRNLAILTETYIKPEAPKAAKELMECLIAFPSTLMHLCLGGAAKLSEDAQRLLPPAAQPELYQLDYALPAMLLVKRMQECIHHATIECPKSASNLMISAHFAEGGHLINALMDSATSCEKILRTPIPWTYTRHLSRFLTLYMGTLPFALIGNISRPLTIAIVAAASYSMFGIEEISHLIEQPFLGDKLQGDNEVWGVIDGNGEVATLIKRGRTTQPYDIGIPVCSLALQIRDYVAFIAAQGAHNAEQKSSRFASSLMSKSSTGFNKNRFSA